MLSRPPSAAAGWSRPQSVTQTVLSVAVNSIELHLRQPESHSTMQRFTALTGFLPAKMLCVSVKELGLCAENKTAAELVTRAEAAQLLHAVLTQTLTVVPPDTPITVENLTQWNVNTFLLELRKVPQPILDAFNENGWTFVIGTEYLTELSRKLGVNCIGAAVYTEKRIYVSEASAVLHEFGHFLDCTMGFPHEHSITQRCILETPVWIYPGCNTEQLKMLVKLLRLVNSSPSGKTRWADKQ